MIAKTVHVFPSDGCWEVKREGKSGKMFVTQREAVDAARETLKKESAGQFVVHGRDGQIREHGAYRMTPIQDPPKKSSGANDIARAVSKVALIRVKSDTLRERPSKANHVFINCPFDSRYKPIFNAIVFSVYDLGFVARCSLEEDDAADFRLAKIERMIEQCRFGINDISAVALDDATKLPRFNMPLELGLFLGCRRFGAKTKIISARSSSTVSSTDTASSSPTSPARISALTVATRKKRLEKYGTGSKQLRGVPG